MKENTSLHPNVLAATAPLLKQMKKREEAYMNRHTQYTATPEMIEKMHRYNDRVHQEKKRRLISVYSKYYKTLDYDMLRRRLFKIAQRNARKDGKRFTVKTDLEKWIWQQGLKWLTYQPDCEWSLDKDLVLFGLTGVGKTFFCKCLVELSNEIKEIVHPLDKWLFEWGFVELNDLYEECVLKKSFTPIGIKTSGNWIFDELGNEKLSIKIFSNETRFFERIITKREAGKHPKRAIYISNHDLNGLLKFYNSSRFESRFRRLIEEEILMNGDDKRTTKSYEL